MYCSHMLGSILLVYSVSAHIFKDKLTIYSDNDWQGSSIDLPIGSGPDACQKIPADPLWNKTPSFKWSEPYLCRFYMDPACPNDSGNSAPYGEFWRDFRHSVWQSAPGVHKWSNYHTNFPAWNPPKGQKRSYGLVSYICRSPLSGDGLDAYDIFNGPNKQSGRGFGDHDKQPGTSISTISLSTSAVATAKTSESIAKATVTKTVTYGLQ